MFTLENIRSIPLPKPSTLFALLFFAVPALCLVHFHKPQFSEAISGLEDFIRTERSAEPRHPQILIAGSSLSMCGVSSAEIENRTNRKTANVSLFVCTPSVILKILNRFEKETSSAKVLLLELAPERLGDNPHWHEVLKIHDDFFSFYTKGYDIPRENAAALLKRMKRKKQEDNDFEKNVEAGRRIAREKLPTRDMPVSERSAGTSAQYYNVEAGFSGENDPEEFQAVRDIQKLCRERGIFLVVFVTPQWYGQLNLSEDDLETSPPNEYIALLQELKRQPDCEVFVCDDFTNITDEGTDEDYLFDYGHMTEKGAKVYTEWLVDRMLEAPKVVAALDPRPERIPEPQNREIKIARPEYGTVR